MKFVVTFMYCIVMSMAYGVVFKKKFEESLATAFFLHIMLMLLCGIIFGHVSIGMFGGIVIALGILLYHFIRKVRNDEKFELQKVVNIKSGGV